MSDDYPSLYSDAQRYDLVAGEYATGKVLDFYRRQIARYGEPVLELACGSGRFTIPLAEAGIQITGLDLSAAMLNLATAKAATRGVRVALVRGDMRSFNLGKAFKLIFIPAQSLTHLYTREDIEACFARVRQHLAAEGRFLIELFNSSVKVLARDSAHRYRVGEYTDPNGGAGRICVTEEVRYEAATQLNHIRWFFCTEGEEAEAGLSFAMRQFFPQEIEALLWYNGFVLEQKYGSYEEAAFCSASPKQLIVCRSK